MSLSSLIGATNTPRNDPLLTSTHLLHYLQVVRCRIRAHIHASWDTIIDIAPIHAHFDDFVGLLHSLGSDNDLTASTLSLVSQIAREYLLLGSHELTHSYFDFTDGIVVTAAIAIDKHKLETLNFLEEVAKSESSFEIRVQGVIDLLSLAELHPLVIPFLIEDALWIRLAESVQIFKLSARDVQIYLHLQLTSRWLMCLHHTCFVRFNKINLNL